MADRYVLRLGSFPADSHFPLGAEGDMAAHLTFETDLPKHEVVQRLEDLALAMDAERTQEPPP